MELGAEAQYDELQRECKAQFEQLSYVPHYTRYHWQEFFTVAFESYTKLWQLVKKKKDELALSGRVTPQVLGNIASKIGQLYYHYYLRNGDVLYLEQAVNFYQTIARHKYFDIADSCDTRARAKTTSVKEDKSSKDGNQATATKLRSATPSAADNRKVFRYCARYCLSAMLLFSSYDHVASSVAQLGSFITHSKAQGEPNWLTTITSARALLDCIAPHDRFVSTSTFKRHRPDYSARNSLLAAAIIVGCCPIQVQLSGTNIDMLRVCGATEYAPSKHVSSAVVEPTMPIKQLLYQPTTSQFMAAAFTAVKDSKTYQPVLYFISTSVPVVSSGVTLRNVDEDSADLENVHLVPDDVNSLFRRGDSVLIVDAPDAMQHFQGLQGRLRHELLLILRNGQQCLKCTVRRNADASASGPSPKRPLTTCVCSRQGSLLTLGLTDLFSFLCEIIQAKQVTELCCTNFHALLEGYYEHVHHHGRKHEMSIFSDKLIARLYANASLVNALVSCLQATAGQSPPLFIWAQSLPLSYLLLDPSPVIKEMILKCFPDYQNYFSWPASCATLLF
eukprot:m.24524 g.24524  ORF g.24524 m.24524 type:complete len:561 (+) comp8604_c0_seq1:62-1744(+)